MGIKGFCRSYADFKFLYECSGDDIILGSSFISLYDDLNLKRILLSHLFRSNYLL